jgi:hypothetical protein
VQKALDGGTQRKDFDFYQGKMFTLRYFFADAIYILKIF